MIKSTQNKDFSTNRGSQFNSSISNAIASYNFKNPKQPLAANVNDYLQLQINCLKDFTENSETQSDISLTDDFGFYSNLDLTISDSFNSYSTAFDFDDEQTYTSETLSIDEQTDTSEARNVTFYLPTNNHVVVKNDFRYNEYLAQLQADLTGLKSLDFKNKHLTAVQNYLINPTQINLDQCHFEALEDEFHQIKSLKLKTTILKELQKDLILLKKHNFKNPNLQALQTKLVNMMTLKPDDFSPTNRF